MKWADGTWNGRSKGSVDANDTGFFGIVTPPNSLGGKKIHLKSLLERTWKMCDSERFWNLLSHAETAARAQFSHSRLITEKCSTCVKKHLLWTPWAHKNRNTRKKMISEKHVKNECRNSHQKCSIWTCLSMEREARLINATLSTFVRHSHTSVHMHGG